jgi:hypothetical protein
MIKLSVQVQVRLMMLMLRLGTPHNTMALTVALALTTMPMLSELTMARLGSTPHSPIATLTTIPMLPLEHHAALATIAMTATEMTFRRVHHQSDASRSGACRGATAPRKNSPQAPIALRGVLSFLRETCRCDRRQWRYHNDSSNQHRSVDEDQLSVRDIYTPRRMRVFRKAIERGGRVLVHCLIESRACIVVCAYCAYSYFSSSP